MGFSPLSLLVLPSILCASIPLAVFATFTTIFAFSVLIIRALLIYVDLALYLLPRSQIQTAAKPITPLPLSSPVLSTSLAKRHHHRRRRSSVASSTVSDPPTSLGLIPSLGPDRDYEGIGGWRVSHGTQEGKDDPWVTVNPRPTSSHTHHHRTPSAGPTTPGTEGYLVMKRRSPRVGMSPNSSRARTPTGIRGGGLQVDGYFALSRNTSPMPAKRG
ncbi:uncharacterized protein F5Z01DRAFT_510946 [Emericellopsis atlantica]|uniref:Uncharacterized protein n=1 Tax=Emericellopsis atlantica TaxID=2614577 RepID=A0A9P7ZRQ3_9HYPO|nr:uncharacterized protein F5Z01DRAFT_510946 [Emericellopsis atlantica]KAG9256460.1 hypothetical protein F5Z01DRAFT_510946 [Emericellopsis atlantica]